MTESGRETPLLDNYDSMHMELQVKGKKEYKQIDVKEKGKEKKEDEEPDASTMSPDRFEYAL